MHILQLPWDKQRDKVLYAGGGRSELKDGNGTYAMEYLYEFGGYNDVKLLLGYISNDEEVGIE